MHRNQPVFLTAIVQILFVCTLFAQSNGHAEGPPFNFFFQDRIVPAGETACMDVVVENFTDVSSFQFAFSFDGAIFNFEELMTSELDPDDFMEGPPFNYDPINSIITVLYVNLDSSTLLDQSVAFSLCFEAIGSEGESSQVVIPNTLPNGNMAQLFIADGTSFAIPEFNLVPGTFTIGEEENSIECTDLCFELGTRWIYGGNEITLNRDSIICGEIWYGMSELDFCSRNLQDLFLRKDDEAIWMHDPATNVSSILYDFTKGTEESWEITLPGGAPSHTVFVDSVSIVNVGGRELQVQHISDDPYTSFYDFGERVYEGIGSNHFLFPTGNLCDGGANGLICYSTAGEQISFDANGQCEPTSTNDLLPLSNLTLHPNPVQDNLYLEATEQNWSYQVFNLQGQQIMQGQYQDNIGVSQLPSGIYFLQLSRENELYKAIKFVKE